MNPYSEFTCLYTSQKQKKAKTWHDGHLKYFHNNSKVVLYDSKLNVLDSTFHRGAALAVGDDMDMDKHLVTVEDLTVEYATNSADPGTAAKSVAAIPAPARMALPGRSTPSYQPPRPTGRLLTAAASSSTRPIDATTTISAGRPMNGSTHQPAQSSSVGSSSSYNAPQPDLKRKKWRAPFTNKDPSHATPSDTPPDHLSDGDFENWDTSDILDFDDTPPPSASATKITATGTINTMHVSSFRPVSAMPPPSGSTTLSREAPKRRKVGLSRPTGSLDPPGQSSLMTPHKPPSTQLEFPNAARCTNFTGKNSGQLLRRSMALGSRFMSTNQYRDSMTFLIYEHLQIMVIEIAITLWSIKSSGKSQDKGSQDALYRSRGVHMHSGSVLRRRGDAYTGFPIYKSPPGTAGSMETGGSSVAVIQPSSQQGAVLSLANKEHHSKYSKDDLWVVSQSSRFDAATTFFARSVFYGPSGNDVEIICLSPGDSSKARDMLLRTNDVCAIRLFNGMSEFMMLDNLQDGLTKTPLLPTLLNYVPPELVKASRTAVFKTPSRLPEKCGCIVLTEEDGIDMENELQDTIEKYRLNQEQATVLRNFAHTVVRAPRWSLTPSEPPPILLVHGVFGAGKSFLIAVLIVFIDTLLSKARPLPKDVRSCRFLVTSMTNVAVDRILMALLDLGYSKFVRVGSLKKVAKRVLPFTAQSTTARTGEDVKELQAILNDDSLSTKERHFVKDAMKRFQRQDNRGLVEKADVVGATCVASMFEAMDEASFPIVILDEASQLLEPMSLIPICRAACQKIVMVGDPLQLSPPINTTGDSAVKGLSRTLFDRSIEMGIKPIMLRTQYRCHERIAEISNALFYSNVLRTGASLEDRAPLFDGLPTLSFIENQGQEIQNPRSKSYTNPAEIKLIVTIIQRLLHLNIPETSIGVISLYKSQADGIESELNEQLKSSGQKGGVQISTVDAFQGSEKEVIIVSTVRTDAIGFIDNHQRVNVALTRSKRHLFIVGHSQLLYSNKTWGAILKDHCESAPDGMMRGETFMQRLRTLKPLHRQMTPPPQMQLVESEDEENLEDNRLDHEDHDMDREEQDYYDDGEDSVDDGYNNHEAPVPASASVGPRKYALYEADEEESDDGYDDRGSNRNNPPPRLSGVNTSNPHRKQDHQQDDDYDDRSSSRNNPPPRLNGVSTPHRKQDSQQDNGYDGRGSNPRNAPSGHSSVNISNPHRKQSYQHDDDYSRKLRNVAAQGDCQRYTDNSPRAQEGSICGSAESYGDDFDDDSRELEDILAAHREASPTLPPVVRQSSFSTSRIQKIKLEYEPPRRRSPEGQTVAETPVHIPPKVSKEPTDVAEEEDAEEVVWEMDEEYGEHIPVDSHSSPADHQAADGRMQEDYADINQNDFMQEEEQKSVLDPMSTQQVDRTTQQSLGSFESQQIEDLEVVGLSQWTTPVQVVAKESSVNPVTVAPVTLAFDDSVDAAADTRPMATTASGFSLSPKDKDEERKPVTGTRGDEGEEDDISCLEVGDFEY